MASSDLSKIFKKELQDLTDIDDFSPTSGEVAGEAEFVPGTGKGGDAKITADYDIPADMTTSKRNKLRKNVTRAMALQLTESFKENMSSQRGTTLEALALKLSGATEIGSRRSSRKLVSYVLGDGGDDSTNPEGSSSTLVDMQDGSRRRTTTLQPLLRELMQRYETLDMTRQNAPLKYKSGRFVESSEITRISTTKMSNGKDTLSLYYTYMLYPYSVFDPAVSNHRGLSSTGRNPQRIIGQALQNAAKDVISARYNLNIRQE